MLSFSFSVWKNNVQEQNIGKMTFDVKFPEFNAN